MSTATKSKKKAQNALDLLKADHNKVKKLFDDFEKTEEETEQMEIAKEAMKELKIHAAIEEEIFYPAVREQLEDQEIMDEAEEEHRVAKTVLEELEGGSSSDEHFRAKFMVMAENVRHHIKEEEGEMFKEVKKTDIDLEALAEQMMMRKQELESDESALQEATEKSAVKPYQELAV